MNLKKLHINNWVYIAFIAGFVLGGVMFYSVGLYNGIDLTIEAAKKFVNVTVDDQLIKEYVLRYQHQIGGNLPEIKT